MHSHLVPGIDDGSASMKQSLSLINNLRDLGFKKIVTTPHSDNDLYRNTNEKITKAFSLLKEQVEKNRRVYSKIISR